MAHPSPLWFLRVWWRTPSWLPRVWWRTPSLTSQSLTVHPSWLPRVGRCTPSLISQSLTAHPPPLWFLRVWWRTPSLISQSESDGASPLWLPMNYAIPSHWLVSCYQDVNPESGILLSRCDYILRQQHTAHVCNLKSHWPSGSAREPAYSRVKWLITHCGLTIPISRKAGEIIRGEALHHCRHSRRRKLQVWSP